MSPKAVVDPEELERFARDLKAFSGQLSDSMSRLHGQFSNLGESWRDQEQIKFAQQFEQTLRVLHQFQQAADQQVPFLLRKAQAVRNYLNQY